MWLIHICVPEDNKNISSPHIVWTHAKKYRWFHFLTCISIAWFFKAKLQADVQLKQSEHLVKKLIKKFEKCKSNPAVLEENFPFYVLLVARMHRWELCKYLHIIKETITESKQTISDIQAQIIILPSDTQNKLHS